MFSEFDGPESVRRALFSQLNAGLGERDECRVQGGAIVTRARGLLTSIRVQFVEQTVDLSEMPTHDDAGAFVTGHISTETDMDIHPIVHIFPTSEAEAMQVMKVATALRN